MFLGVKLVTTGVAAAGLPCFLLRNEIAITLLTSCEGDIQQLW